MEPRFHVLRMREKGGDVETAMGLVGGEAG